jgi:Holin of 3TMs, for gene-transfer release
MNPLVLGSVLELGQTLLNRFIPDKEEARKAEAEFLKLAMDGELRQVLAQLEINAKEAEHASWWVAGWRPYFGWVGGTAFLYVGLLKPILAWISAIKGWPAPPDIDTEFLWVVVSGLLGIGGLRTYEKKQGVTK